MNYQSIKNKFDEIWSKSKHEETYTYIDRGWKNWIELIDVDECQSEVVCDFITSITSSDSDVIECDTVVCIEKRSDFNVPADGIYGEDAISYTGAFYNKSVLKT